MRGMDQYQNGHHKFRCMIIQCKVSNETDEKEHETVLMIVLGLIEHPTYVA